jgi:hypothetical protein
MQLDTGLSIRTPICQEDSLTGVPFSTSGVLLNLSLSHVPSILPPMRGKVDSHRVFQEPLAEASRTMISDARRKWIYVRCCGNQNHLESLHVMMANSWLLGHHISNLDACCYGDGWAQWNNRIKENIRISTLLIVRWYCGSKYSIYLKYYAVLRMLWYTSC